MGQRMAMECGQACIAKRIIIFPQEKKSRKKVARIKKTESKACAITISNSKIVELFSEEKKRRNTTKKVEEKKPKPGKFDRAVKPKTVKKSVSKKRKTKKTRSTFSGKGILSLIKEKAETVFSEQNPANMTWGEILLKYNGGSRNTIFGYIMP